VRSAWLLSLTSDRASARRPASLASPKLKLGENPSLW
jgi:hypothetical protein